jgi:hypothetical protein
MSARFGPGTAFWIPTDAGFALGIVAHQDKEHTYGSLVWMADRFFEEPPTIDDVASVGWRWCVFFPVGAAARRRIVELIGKTDLPKEIQGMPLLRSGGITGMNPRWIVVRDVVHRVRTATADDMALSIKCVVNDTRLIEMLVTGWKPEDWV